MPKPDRDSMLVVWGIGWIMSMPVEKIEGMSNLMRHFLESDHSEDDQLADYLIRTKESH